MASPNPNFQTGAIPTPPNKMLNADPYVPPEQTDQIAQQGRPDTQTNELTAADLARLDQQRVDKSETA